MINYADIPISQFVDIILKGDDEAMYYLLHERLKHLLYERYQDYSHHLYDDFEDLLDDFFIYIRESEHTPYQALQRIKKKGYVLHLISCNPSPCEEQCKTL